MTSPWQRVLTSMRSEVEENLDAAFQKCQQLMKLTLEQDKSFNLTAIRDEVLFEVRHLEDAILAAALIEKKFDMPLAKMADIGSGAGVPGLVWAIVWPETEVHLLEATGKKCDFLRLASRELSLPNVVVHQGRAERLGHNEALREQFPCVTARAVAELPTLLELAAPFVSPGGSIAALKSARIETEWARAEHAAQVLMGLDLRTIKPHEYQRSDGCLCTVCLLPKRQTTPAQYPRRDGVPAKRPLLKKHE